MHLYCWKGVYGSVVWGQDGLVKSVRASRNKSVRKLDTSAAADVIKSYIYAGYDTIASTFIDLDLATYEICLFPETDNRQIASGQKHPGQSDPTSGIVLSYTEHDDSIFMSKK